MVNRRLEKDVDKLTEAEKKVRFIQMRAEGQSYGKISTALNISKTTCSRWNKELKDQTDKQEAETLQELYKMYGATREARIKATGETLQKINTALEKKDYSDIPLDKLLALKLKYIEQLKTDYSPITEGAALPDTLTPQGVLDVLKDLLKRVYSGEITEKQAEQEAKILTAIITALKRAENAPESDPNINIIIKPASMADYENEIKQDRNDITILEDLEPDQNTEKE